MSILDNMVPDVNEAQEPQVMEQNSEHKLRILSVKSDHDKSGNPYVMPRFEVVGQPLAKDFSKFLSVPTKDLQGEDAKKFERAKYAMKEFMTAFGIDPARPGDPEDWAGLEGWAILGVEDSAEYGKQNYVKKFVGGR